MCRSLLRGLIVLHIFWYPLFANAQVVEGKLQGKVIVFRASQLDADDDDASSAIGANIGWLGSTVYTRTKPDGTFSIKKVPGYYKLLVSYLNYAKDTLEIADTAQYIICRIKPIIKNREGVTITAKKATTQIAYLAPNQVLNIGKGELLKAACCNLSESFETTPSVDVSYTDAITGQKQIQLLGLATPNTLFTQENIPNLKGLASIVGLNYTPGTWVNDMQLSKGSGSVANGYEGIAGQINVELIKPTANEKLIVNLYQNNNGRSEGNMVLNKKWNDRMASGLMLHHKNQWYYQDNNKDGFADNPLGGQSVALYRMQYFTPKGFELQGIIKYVNINEEGGKLKSALPNQNWKYTNNVERLESSMKIGKAFPSKPWKSMGLQLSYITHMQNIGAGARNYNGKQSNAYANYIFQSVIGNTNHKFRAGASMAADNVLENIPASNPFTLNRKELVVGTFAEHTYNYLDKFSLVSGLRIDNHNLFGTFLTPRVHLRYKLFGETTLRLNFGRAQRTASVLSENMAALFSNRVLVFKGDSTTWKDGLQREVTYNYGSSLTQPFTLNYRKGSVIVDAYYSTFNNQWLADFETPGQVSFYNINGNSFSKSLQLQADYEIIRKRMDVRIAYRYYDIQNKYRDSAMLQKPLISKHRAFLNVAYSTRSKWKLDGTLVWSGSMRLPNFYADNTIFPEFNTQQTKGFFILNGHVSKIINKKLDVYLGGENLTNFMQHHAIISSGDVQNASFDASQIWGPIMGVNVYAGMRYILK